QERQRTDARNASRHERWRARFTTTAIPRGDCAWHDGFPFVLRGLAAPSVVPLLPPVHAPALLWRQVIDLLGLDPRTRTASQVHDTNTNRYHRSIDIYISDHRGRRHAPTN